MFVAAVCLTDWFQLFRGNSGADRKTALERRWVNFAMSSAGKWHERAGWRRDIQPSRAVEGWRPTTTWRGLAAPPPHCPVVVAPLSSDDVNHLSLGSMYPPWGSRCGRKPLAALPIHIQNSWQTASMQNFSLSNKADDAFNFTLVLCEIYK